MTATLDNAVADLQRDNAELRRQLDACRTELAARNSEYAERIEQQSATIDVLSLAGRSAAGDRLDRPQSARSVQHPAGWLVRIRW